MVLFVTQRELDPNVVSTLARHGWCFLVCRKSIARLCFQRAR